MAEGARLKSFPLRLQLSVLVIEWGRGFESNFGQNLFLIYLAHFFIATSTPLPQTKKQDQEASNENFTKWVDIAMNDENEFTASEFSFIIEFLNWLSSNDF